MINSNKGKCIIAGDEDEIIVDYYTINTQLILYLQQKYGFKTAKRKMETYLRFAIEHYVEGGVDDADKTTTS